MIRISQIRLQMVDPVADSQSEQKTCYFFSFVDVAVPLTLESVAEL